jgi:hypothetical protein
MFCHKFRRALIGQWLAVLVAERTSRSWLMSIAASSLPVRVVATHERTTDSPSSHRVNLAFAAHPNPDRQLAEPVLPSLSATLASCDDCCLACYLHPITYARAHLITIVLIEPACLAWHVWLSATQIFSGWELSQGKFGAQFKSLTQLLSGDPTPFPTHPFPSHPTVPTLQ